MIFNYAKYYGNWACDCDTIDADVKEISIKKVAAGAAALVESNCKVSFPLDFWGKTGFMQSAQMQLLLYGPHIVSDS